jgi:hypothetical protein
MVLNAPKPTRNSRVVSSVQGQVGQDDWHDAVLQDHRVKTSEVKYYWATPSALAKEVGAEPNEFGSRLDDEVVFRDYATACLSLGKIPSEAELRIAQRELKIQTHSVRTRDGSIQAFQDKFREWLRTSGSEFKAILDFAGWARAKPDVATKNGDPAVVEGPVFHPFLPACLQYFEVLARGEMPPYESAGGPASLLFERRTADAFRCLGFEIQQLGQGTGRNADCIATAPRERVALIIDAKVRSNGYILGTEDRKFLEYAVTHCAELQRKGFTSIYLVVVGPSFRESDLQKLGEYIATTPIRSVVMITAGAMIRLVEDSIKQRSTFSIGDLTKQMFGNKIILG